MAAKVCLSVEVQGDDLVVSLPGTTYVVTYYRATAFPQRLLTKSPSGREDEIERPSGSSAYRQVPRSMSPRFAPARSFLVLPDCSRDDG